MTLIKSISGIRGTVGGFPGDNLTPIDVVKFTSAYATWIKNNSGKEQPKVVVGRDARLSGQMYSDIVCSTLCSLGIHVINIGMATTPTTEVAVTGEAADGGIILTKQKADKIKRPCRLIFISRIFRWEPQIQFRLPSLPFFRKSCLRSRCREEQYRYYKQGFFPRRFLCRA